MSAEALATYLNDHLAGSVAAVELLDRLIDHAAFADARETLVKLRSEIRTDQLALEDILRAAGGRESLLRQVGGWLAEKAGRLKLLVDDPMRGALERLEAFEILTLGIQGKAALWRALAAVQPHVPSLQSVDFRELERRADDQRATVEALRMAAAQRILTRGA
jgi:hypothetical protein